MNKAARFFKSLFTAGALLTVVATMVMAILMEASVYVLAGAIIVSITKGIISGVYDWHNIAAFIVLAFVFKYMGNLLERDGRVLYKKFGFKHSGSEEECPVTGAKATGYYDNGSKYE